jgi:phage baseplate assembly protein V
MRAYLDRTARRVMSALAQGLVKVVNDSAGIQLMQVKFNPLQTIDNLPRCAEYGFTSNPPEDSDAVVAFAGGDRSNGVVIATGNAKVPHDAARYWRRWRFTTISGSRCT